MSSGARKNTHSPPHQHAQGPIHLPDMGQEAVLPDFRRFNPQAYDPRTSPPPDTPRRVVRKFFKERRVHGRAPAPKQIGGPELAAAVRFDLR
jgi:hypothetical protein